jgi:SH3 domain
VYFSLRSPPSYWCYSDHSPVHVVLTARINTRPALEWWKGSCKGSHGRFPSNYVEEMSGSAAPAPPPSRAPAPAVGGTQARGKYPYKATRPDEISFAKGELVTIVEKKGNWWKVSIRAGLDSSPSGTPRTFFEHSVPPNFLCVFTLFGLCMYVSVCLSVCLCLCLCLCACVFGL